MSMRDDFKVLDITKTISVIQERMAEMKRNGIHDSFEYEMDILTNMPEFYQEYPFLVKKVTSGQDMSYLYKMLDTLNNVQYNNTSFANAELKLGKELADEFLYPALEKNKK